MYRNKVLQILSVIAIVFVSIAVIIGIVYPVLANEPIYVPFVFNGGSNINQASEDESLPITNVNVDESLPTSTPTPDLAAARLAPNIQVTPPIQEVQYETMDLAPEVPFADKYFLLVRNNRELVAYLVPESMLEAKLVEVGSSLLVLEIPPNELSKNLEAESKAREQIAEGLVDPGDYYQVAPPPTVEYEPTPFTDSSKVIPPPVPPLPGELGE
jgi:hypothetical protein